MVALNNSVQINEATRKVYLCNARVVTALGWWAAAGNKNQSSANKKQPKSSSSIRIVTLTIYIVNEQTWLKNATQPLPTPRSISRGVNEGKYLSKRVNKVNW